MIFDVSGINGAPGASGIDYDYLPAPVDYDGSSGGHGETGQRGTSAGIIAMQLTTPISTANIPKNVILANPSDADVKLLVSNVDTADQPQNMDTIIKINSGESIYLHARGGNGGRGGDGGNGQDGGKGFRYSGFSRYSPSIESISEYAWENRGKDATEDEDGTDGGRGGDGGDGGNAGRGGDGGHGGKIRLSVPKADTYLLMLMLYGTVDFSGGVGGLAGNPGRGGQSFHCYLTASSG